MAIEPLYFERNVFSSIITRNIDDLLKVLDGVTPIQGGYIALCPAHDDENPSLSVTEKDGKILLHCFAGCQYTDILKALGLTPSNLYTEKGEKNTKVCTDKNASYGVIPARDQVQNTVTTTEICPVNGVTVEALSQKKHLPIDCLKSLGLKDCKYRGRSAITFPYLDENGKSVAVRYRLTLTAQDNEQRFAWQKGEHVLLYGLDHLQKIRDSGWVLLVEGESNCWTAWYHNLAALGIPGKSNWKAEWTQYLAGLKVYLWQDPDAEDLAAKVGQDIPDLHVIPAPNGVKDISEAHIQGKDITQYLEGLKAKSSNYEEIKIRLVEKESRQLYQEAIEVIEAEDPLEIIKAAIKELGYGGDQKPPIITYLSATSRVLEMREGTMPVHLLLLGSSSSGKSYTVSVVKKMLPPEAYHEIDAGSPRVFIYDQVPLKHKILIVKEADSLPKSEDNPASSALRNLLQDHNLHYETTIKDERSGRFTVQKICKEGPTVLITTSIYNLRQQLSSRLFTLEMREDPKQIQ